MATEAETPTPAGMGWALPLPPELLCCVCGTQAVTAATPPAQVQRWRMVISGMEIVTICPRHLVGTEQTGSAFFDSLGTALAEAKRHSQHAREN